MHHSAADEAERTLPGHQPIRVACYGGAFDPPHLAHLFTVTYLLGRADVDRVWIVPTADHVFGKQMAPFAERVAMLRAALAACGLGDEVDSGRVVICPIEAELPGPSRTFDTLTLLGERHPEHVFRWVIGADNLTESHRWHRFDDLVARWDLIVLGRPGHEAALAARADEPWCRPGPTLPDVSSTAIRAALRGVGPRDTLRWLPDAILDRARRLYRPAPSPVQGPVWVLGAGRAGGALADGLRRAGVEVFAWNRSAAPGVDAHGALPDLATAPIWLIAVSDDAIEGFARRLAAHPAAGPGRVVLHCAGRLGAEVLAPLAERGAAVGSLHPLQSLDRDGEALWGAFCAIEGDDIAGETAEALARALNCRPVRLPRGEKAAYHAAAVLSANFLTTLGAGGVALLGALGVAEPLAREMLVPLLRGTVDRFAAAPAAQALTGPFARGDFETIAAHVPAIAKHAPGWLDAYRALAWATAALLGWDDTRRAALTAALTVARAAPEES